MCEPIEKSAVDDGMASGTVTMNILVYRVVSGIVRRGDEIVLVQQQAKHDEFPTWSLPGGKVENHELLHEALIREIAEETGLIVDDIGALVSVTHHDNREQAMQAITFIFEITAWHGDIKSADPDQVVCDVQFVKFDEAHRLLQTLPWATMREPIQAYLHGTTKRGSVWLYRTMPNQPTERIHVLEG